MAELTGMTAVPHHFGALTVCGAQRKIFSVDMSHGHVRPHAL